MTQTAIRTLIEHSETDPVKFVNTLNRTIYKNVRRTHAEKTLTLPLVNYHDHQLKIVGQHEEVLVVRNGGRVGRIDTVNLGFSLGLAPDISQWIGIATVSLEPGDSLVLYTDGIIEAENAQRALYGIERLCSMLNANWTLSAEAIKQAVIADVL